MINMRVQEITISFQGGNVNVREAGNALRVLVNDCHGSDFIIRRSVALALCKALGAMLVTPVDLPTPSSGSAQILTNDKLT